MNQNRITSFMLEQYILGELSLERKNFVEDALKNDPKLQEALEALKISDNQIRAQYPFEASGLKAQVFKRRNFNRARTRISIALAAVLLCVLMPVFIFQKDNSDIQELSQLTERPKGQAPTGSELFLYVRGFSDPVPHNQAVLQEGNTLQLAYLAPAGSEYYGVIFSIDGRSEVTMHYPYKGGQSSLLVSGRRTLLNEAYILDDAPDYEIFVFVVSSEPLSAEAVFNEALAIAQGSENAETIKAAVIEIFEDNEVEFLTVRKEAKELYNDVYFSEVFYE